MPVIIDLLNVSPVVAELAQGAVDDIDARYSPDGLTPLPYHNVYHTLEVIEASAQIGRRMRIWPGEFGNLIIAAAFLDYDYILNDPQNEARSAEAAVEAMRATGEFPSGAYDQVADMIMSTRTSLLGGRLVQTAETYLGKILADADLASLGRPPAEYWTSALNLFQEQNPGEPLNGTAMRNFAAFQVRILESHVFYTAAANIIFNHKPQNKLYALTVSQSGSAA